MLLSSASNVPVETSIDMMCAASTMASNKQLKLLLLDGFYLVLCITLSVKIEDAGDYEHPRLAR